MLAVSEGYPELKTDGNFRALQCELSATEDRLAFARAFANDRVARYREMTDTLPGLLLARRFGLPRGELFAPKERRDRPVRPARHDLCGRPPVVVDNLDVTFSQQRRAIFRDLDGQMELPGYGGCDFRVDRGDASDPWHLQFEPGTAGPRIRIGEAATYLDPGTYRYRIGYSAPRGTTSWPTIWT